MYVQSLTVFSWGFPATPTNLVALAGKRPLSTPRLAVVSIITALVSWMKITANVLRAPFAVTLVITKQMLLFALSVSDIFSSDWFTTISTRWAAVSSFFHNIAPTPSAAAFIRTTLYEIMRAVYCKFLAAPFTKFSNKAAGVTIICVSYCVKCLIAIPTNANRILAIRHVSLPLENVTRIDMSWGVRTGSDLSAGNYSAQALTHYIIRR